MSNVVVQLKQATATDLTDMPTFAWLRERDVDILLASELHHDGDVRQLFAERLGFEGCHFVGAWVSVHEIDGENDMVAEWAGNGKRYIALIENKIGAVFQPNQAERYRLRKEKWRSQIEGDVRTLLFCPADYAQTEEARRFDIVLPYENVYGVCNGAQDGRSLFFSRILASGVEAYGQGYIPVPSEAVSAFWQHLWLAAARYPKLRMERPSVKPARSTWIYFRQAEGLHGVSGVTLVLKGSVGYVDLQFSTTGVEELGDRARHILADDMAIVKAGKSAAIRLKVTPLQFDGSVFDQDQAIQTSFEACSALREFFLLHKAQLVG